MGVGEMHHLDDVFGVSRDVPLTYVEREKVDQKFVGSLSRKKHIVVYGGSKQGKTCLRKRSLRESDYISVQCAGTTTRSDIYRMVLKDAGAAVDVLEKKTTRGNAKLGVTIGWKAKIPFLGDAKAESQGEISGERETERERRY